MIVVRCGSFRLNVVASRLIPCKHLLCALERTSPARARSGPGLELLQ
jgi:hypothetical protein